MSADPLSELLGTISGKKRKLFGGYRFAARFRRFDDREPMLRRDAVALSPFARRFRLHTDFRSHCVRRRPNSNDIAKALHGASLGPPVLNCKNKVSL
jgi:hypothetical protein